VRPILKPGLCRVWLDRDTLQLGIGPRCRVLRLDTASRCLIEALDGTRDTAALLSYAQRLGITAERAAGLLDRLALDGALDDAALPTPGLARLSVNERARLEPVVSALGLRNRLPGGGARALERRAQQYAAVHGLGLIGAQVARHLAAAGVGVVRPVDPSPVEHADTGPGALDPADVGRRRQDAVARAIQRLTPAARIAPVAHSRPDLVVLAPTERYPVELLDQLMTTGLPHLPVRTMGDMAMIGPLVLPGRTPCVRCADLQQSENDPSWPRYLAHLGPPRSGELPPRDTPLALSAVACTVQTALSFLDGESPAALGGVLCIAPDAHTAVRIELPPHAACTCGACGDAPGAHHRLPSPRDFVHGELLE
jgi:bacteriocin biosynthesis cyclodehydratase domain-containing protein